MNLLSPVQRCNFKTWNARLTNNSPDLCLSSNCELRTMLVPKKYTQLLCFAFFFASLFIYCRTSFNAYREAVPIRPDVGLSSHTDTDNDSEIEPANSTLGFGAVFAVSALDSPRRTKLIQAANVTGMDLTIPDLPEWSVDDENRFRAGLKEEDRDAGHGSIMAWFSHIHLLRL